MKRLICFFIIIGFTGLSGVELSYNITYLVQGEVRGAFLMFIPYRVCFEVSGSVDFKAWKNRFNQYEFTFDRVNKPGYLFRSLGFRARHFVIVAAYHEMDELLVFLVDKLNGLKNRNPAYSEQMQRTRKLLIKIPAKQANGIRFRRDQFGKHDHFCFNLELRPTFNQPRAKIDFNVYRIMIEFLKTFNHSYLPKNVSNFNINHRYEWKSQWLDFSENINKAAWSVATFIKRFITFKQKHPFRLSYRLNGLDDALIEICGEAHPEVKVWGGYKLKDFYRKVRIRKSDHVLIEDSVYLVIRNQKGRGGDAQIILKLNKGDDLR